MKNKNLIYLDTYILQQDMRIRLPKQILKNIHAEKGKTKFSIYLNKQTDEIVLKILPEGEKYNGQ